MVLSNIWQPRCHRLFINISFLLERKPPSSFEFIKPRAGSLKCLCTRHAIPPPLPPPSIISRFEITQYSILQKKKTNFIPYRGFSESNFSE